MKILTPVRRRVASIASAATIGCIALAAAGAARASSHSLQGFPILGIQPGATQTYSLVCNPGFADMTFDVFFRYNRAPGETGAIPWKITLWEKDLPGNPDDLAGQLTGQFPAIGAGGSQIETLRVLLALDACPYIHALDETDGNNCAEFYGKIEITSPFPGEHVMTFHVQPICCDNCIILPVDLLSFTAQARGSSAVVRWATASETDNVGFRVSRGPTPSGPWAPVHEGLIPAQGSPTSGAEYFIVDGDMRAFATPWYLLEDIDLFGNVTAHEPTLLQNVPFRLRFWNFYPLLR